MARLLGGNAAKQQQCHKVRYCHQGIHAVGNVPDDVEVDDAAKEQEDDVKDAIEAIGLALLDVVDGTLAIVAPPKDGAEGKGQDAKGEQRCTDVGYLGEGYLGERRTVVIGYLGIRQDAADEHDTRQGTDDDGIPEGAGAADQRLADGVAGLGSGSDDGCRTHTTLVGEQAAGNTIAGGHHDGSPYEAATGSRGVEGRLDDELNGGPHIVAIHAEDGDAS